MASDGKRAQFWNGAPSHVSQYLIKAFIWAQLNTGIYTYRTELGYDRVYLYIYIYTYIYIAFNFDDIYTHTFSSNVIIYRFIVLISYKDENAVMYGYAMLCYVLF